MRSLHCADLHCGSRALPNSRERQRIMLKEIHRIAIEHKCDAVIVAGDLIESYATHQDKDDLIEGISALDEARLWTYLIRGNHDPYDAQYSHLESLAILADKKRFRRVFVADKNVECFPLPEEGHYIACAPAAKWTEELLASAIEAVRPPESNWFEVAFHGMIRDSVNDAGSNIFSKTAMMLPDLPFVNVWKLGDIHRFQRIRGHRAWYSGAPRQLDYGDHSGERGVLIHDTRDPENPQFVQLRGLERVVRIKAGEKKPRGALVQISGSASELAALPNSELHGVATHLVTDDGKEAMQQIRSARDGDLAAETLEQMSLDGVEGDDLAIAEEFLREFGV